MRGNGDASSDATSNSESIVSQNRRRTSEYLHLPRSPPPPSRRSSFSKRHASFHSPREVPLPSSPLTCSSQVTGYPFPITASNTRATLLGSKGDNSTGLDHSSTGSLHLSASTQLQPIPHTPDSPPDMNTSDHSGCNQPDTPDPSSATIHQQFSSHSMETQPTPAAPMFPFSRPYSLPDSMQPANWIDGGSALSLPLPLQTPYNLLPRMDGSASPSSSDSQTPSEAPGRRPLPVPPQTNAAPNDPQFNEPSLSNVSSSSQAGWQHAPIPSSPPPPYSA
ncbi:hypothetical protein EDD22DRAFT_347419 [Suillus occidentalis]|nr:hypothetical protein EDD22DRAFT_347419 [Suillus occidentalis]